MLSLVLIVESGSSAAVETLHEADGGLSKMFAAAAGVTVMTMRADSVEPHSPEHLQTSPALHVDCFVPDPQRQALFVAFGSIVSHMGIIVGPDASPGELHPHPTSLALPPQVPAQSTVLLPPQVPAQSFVLIEPHVLSHPEGPG
jgi:hypothetical protein